jgi:hypothetical protein
MKAAARAPILFAVTGIDFFYGAQTKNYAYMIASPFTDMRAQMDMPARDLVGYGANRPQGRWPNGVRRAVSVVVNYEEGSERSHAMRDADQESMTEFGSYALPANVRNLAMESMYEYGSRVGVWRILESLRHAEVPATFFGRKLSLRKHRRINRRDTDADCDRAYTCLQAAIGPGEPSRGNGERHRDDNRQSAHSEHRPDAK